MESHGKITASKYSGRSSFSLTITMSSTDTTTASSATPNSTHIPAPESPIFVFRIPIRQFANGGFELALHRRGNRWFVVFPRAYGMVESRWVASLNNPRDTDAPSTAPPASLSHLNHRFWYNSEHLALDNLLLAEPISSYDNSVQPLLKVTGMSRTEKRRVSGSEVDVQIEAKQVEVLIKEDQLCRPYIAETGKRAFVLRDM